MHLRFPAAAALLALCATSPAWAGKKAEVLEMNAVGEIQIAADGSVSDYHLKSQLAPAVAGLVDRNVRGWRFEPVMVDGKAVIAKTTMHLALKAEPLADTGNYRLRIASIRFGDLTRSAHFVPPKYPGEAVRSHVGGRVIVAVRVDENGDVVDAQPYQTSLDVETRSEVEAEHYRQVLEKASLLAARHWHYDVTDMLNGKPVGREALVPVSYSLCNMPCGNPDGDGRWRALVPGPVHVVPWMHQTLAASQDPGKLRDDESMSLDSPFRLKDDPVGKIL